MDILLKTFIKLFNQIPFRLRIRLGRGLGYLFSFLPTQERAIARLQIAKYLADNPIKPSVAQVYSELGQTLAECLDLTGTLKNSEITWQTSENVSELLERKRPVLILAAHTSNWELLAAELVRIGLKMNVIGRKAQKSYLQIFLSKLRKDYGANTIWRDEAGTAKKILGALAANEAIGVLIDQDTDVSSMYSPFFGQAAKVPSSIVEIGLRQGIDMYSTLIFRDGPQRYSIIFKALDTSNGVIAALEQYNRIL